MSLRNGDDIERDRQTREACLKSWPDAQAGEYNPSCCRFPKSCSCPPLQLLDWPQPTFEDLMIAAARKGLYLEVRVWNDDALELTIAFPDVAVADEAAAIVLEAIEDIHG